MSLEKDKETFKEILLVLQKRSTCVRVKVSSINFNKETHHNFSIQWELHAEQNAISMAAKNGIAINNCDLYTSVSPCSDCAKLIVASGIKRVFYIELYDRDNTINWLKNRGILVEQL
jgi:dCMP deaminase